MSAAMNKHIIWRKGRKMNYFFPPARCSTMVILLQWVTEKVFNNL